MELWYPKAVKRDGPSNKARGSTNDALGVIMHSAEGSWWGLQYELSRTDRGAAWHFSNLKDGTLYQHYSIDTVLWHSGDWGGDQDGADGNGELIAIENEGKVGEPLTSAQLQSAAGLINWIGNEARWVPRRGTSRVGRTLWEHRELSDRGTQCPSGRVQWDKLMSLLQKESPELNVSDPDMWVAIYDALTTQTRNRYIRLPQSSDGLYGEYLFRLRL